MSTSLLTAECIAFKSKQSGAYVSYVRESQGLKKILQVSGKTTTSPFTRFHPEPSSKHDGYCHIKCLYNNKYWAVHQDGSYIFVDANVHNEDLRSPSCTLFRIKSDADNFCRVSHGYAGGGGVSIYTSPDSPRGSLLVGNREPEDFELILMSKTVLPKYVCFKGDNGKYLRVDTHQGRKEGMGFLDRLNELGLLLNPELEPYMGYIDLNFLVFSASDKNDWRAFHTIQTNEDGTICVYNDSVKQWWTLDPKDSPNSWIWADYDGWTGDPSNHRDSTFMPYKIDDNKVGLKCLGNNKFCRRLTDYWEDALNANTETSIAEAGLQVEEPLLSRSIYGVEYHLEDARVYNKGTDSTDEVITENGSSEVTEYEKTKEYSVTEESTWNSSTSWKKGAQLTIGGDIQIPYVGANMELQLQEEQGGSHTWGEKRQVQVKSTHTFKGRASAHKKVTALVMVTRAGCDVPYSYWQEDVLSNGTRLPPQKFDDGIFHGVSNTVTFETIETDI